MIDWARVRAVTLDLDDTLWPVMPPLRRAEAALWAWLAEHAPRTAAQGPDAMAALRAAVHADWPHRLHDLTALRRETLRRALVSAGEDEALAEPAFEVFFAERNRVELYEDVPPALARLSARRPLLAVTNGNADLARVGIDRWFVGTVNAREVGAAKPHRAIFEAACRRLSLPPAAVLHVGDDVALDVEGARAAGLQAVWIDRAGPGSPTALPDLLALCDRLEAADGGP
ncbi:HAD family hydrolase [Aquabacterium sp. J223]|uniref:HAD family hydrolase n=1 Tax=Aquabacterium sp. J223 TaxID=2898431 RepID=UPI0021ADE788|nr:HAD-IA family hydrolase [Aquabacterium sp. J223]UUX95901.1 HAD-IA family hydrolase [Aquabacterium sp. J223]